MKPLIGVVPGMDSDGRNYKVTRNNLIAIEQAGGIPLVLSYIIDLNTIDEIVELIDGLYLTGGGDIDPIYLNEEPHPKLGEFQPERDAFEMQITKRVLAKDKPILGVCKGAQMLNLASGGDMFQDIHSQIGTGLVQHNQKAAVDVPIHMVNLVEGSLIEKLVGERVVRVNSFHHQANRNTGDDFIVSGKAQDGVVEVIESNAHRFALGLQWHPEHLAVQARDELSQKIYRGFIQACKK